MAQFPAEVGLLIDAPDMFCSNTSGAGSVIIAA
jgi:hypothetical protein